MRTVLKVTPQQEKQIEAIWSHMPSSLNELVVMNRQMDAVFTPDQRRIVRPLQRVMRNKVIDDMLEPARSRFQPADFEKFQREIKRRVDAKIEG